MVFFFQAQSIGHDVECVNKCVGFATQYGFHYTLTFVAAIMDPVDELSVIRQEYHES